MRKISKMFVAVLLAITMISAFTVINTASACHRKRRCCCCEPGTVFYIGSDDVTGGDWKNAVGSPLGVYGSYAHILPNAPLITTEVPIGNYTVPIGDYSDPPYNWTSSQIAGLPKYRPDPTYWDEYVSQIPKINYSMIGVLRDSPIGPIQYPVFAWVSTNWGSTDPLAAYFETFIDPEVGGPGWRVTSWDCGSEGYWPPGRDGYFNVSLEFPAGMFMLSLYAYDYSKYGRTWQQYHITNEAGEILSSATISETEFDNPYGVYKQFVVCGPTKIIVNIIKDTPSTNAILSGIFVDKVSCRFRCTRTIGFWKTNLAKLLGYLRGRPQVSESDMESYIDFARARCPEVFSDVDSMEKAYQLFKLKRRSSSMLAKAKAQFYALLLNVASSKAYESDIVAQYLYKALRWMYPTLGLSDYPLALSDVIDFACTNINDETNLEFVKDVCEALNTGYVGIVVVSVP